ncbi:RraA family protein [Bacillus sp. Marseille-P3661]|uniref:RraA family protein n=1 Tax=Bacillus sp. Marseille-P3661 TaxID=1936234 RepID=UPI000C8547F9|nr:S-adenosylmethionine--2-demethylmenaquinone methyltransferase [Bacillus sp. Marseille-P3661]
MVNLPPLFSTDLINRAEQLSTTLFSDSMDCSGGMHYSVKPVSKEKRVIGTAITVELDPGDNLYLHKAIHLASKGYVIVVDGKGYENNAYLGELMALTARARKINGIVIDGLVRDKDVLEQINFPVFAKGFIANGPFKNGSGAINIPIHCGRVLVNPGDLIIGDSDGVVVVPKNRVEETIVKAEAKNEYEKNRLETISKFVNSSDQEIGDLLKPAWLLESEQYNNAN